MKTNPPLWILHISRQDFHRLASGLVHFEPCFPLLPGGVLRPGAIWYGHFASIWHWSWNSCLHWCPAVTRSTQEWPCATGSYPTKGKLNVFPIQLPYVGSPTPHSPSGPSDQRRSLMEGSWCRQEQCWTPAVAKNILFANLTKTQDHGNTMLGLFWGSWKGQGMCRALELGLPLFLVCVWMALPGGAGWGLWGMKLRTSTTSCTGAFPVSTATSGAVESFL